MSVTRLSHSEGVRCVLEAVGVSPIEERFYLALLHDQGAALSTISRAVGISTQRGAVVAAALEEKGLLSRRSGRRQRMVAAPPEAALEPLLQRSQDNLAEVSRSIAELTEEYTSRSGQRNAHELIEIITGTDGVMRRYEQLQRAAREEIRAFVRMPRITPPQTNRTEIRLLSRGVGYRALYDREALRAPGAMEEISLYQSEGEQARALETLPMKLVVADHALALVPLSTGETPVEPGAILVHPSALLDALIALFDALWETAVPLTPVAGERDGGSPTGASARLSGEDARILALLLSGLTDESVARQLSLSVRTVQRRVQKLMSTARVTTRLQLGWHAHMQGWL